MAYQLLTNEYFFWLVALIFYGLSNITLVSKFELLLVEKISNKFIPSFSFNNFEINGRQVCLLNLLTPFYGFIKLKIVPNENPSNNFEVTCKELQEFNKHVFPFKIISCVSFSYLILGPLLTHYVGLGATFLFLLPIHLIMLLVTLSLLLVKKKRLGLENRSALLIFFDCLVVPAYLPTVVRKIYSKKSFSCDGYYYSLHTAADANREELIYSISRKIDQTVEALDEKHAKDYLGYKKKLGIDHE